MSARARFYAEFAGGIAEALFGVAIVVALLNEQWLIAGLVACAYVLQMRWEGRMWCPDELAYWFLALTMAAAYLVGYPGIFFLLSPRPLLRVVSMLLAFGGTNQVEAWEDHFLDLEGRPKLKPLALVWRGMSRRWHVAAWILAIAIGLAWTAGIFLAAKSWDSPLRFAFLAITFVLGLWWIVDAVRALVRLRIRTRPRRPEQPGAPDNWTPTIRVFGEANPASKLPMLDLETGFDGPSDWRLRAFAADCAIHLLPNDYRAGATYRMHRNQALTHTRRARTRANGYLRGNKLETAFALARSHLESFEHQPPKSSDDLERIHTIGDALSAAYHALCAPTPHDAAHSAAQCAGVTADGSPRQREHTWQATQLQRYRDLPHDH